ncbi:helix-turn-helix transcriptional regulator [Massilia antarctica]|uniref:Helix-turn-helix transcriptional regulator n=1 Tax=Massilia antarctica TaxID=2765360 RepID=A0AA48WBR0_9BURK|nr:AraC family transcriptional regulator [Massilia antarctica]QPI48599.1 helix-turn-helix transcriptional regulator [Massilia antarctica]
MPMITSTEDLRRWFLQSGVASPLDLCIGPLPRSKAALGRWSSGHAEHVVRSMSPHPGSYRLSLMLSPLEARIWAGNKPVWGGMIAANRFRISPPGESGQWTQMSACDIVNIFIPVDLVDHLGGLRNDGASNKLVANVFVQDRIVLDLVHKMLNAAAMAGQLAQEACDGLITVLVCYLLEHYTQPTSVPERSGLCGSRLRSVLRHIAQSSAESVSNAELAALCGMSEAHFSREFRRAVGLPPHQYMMKLRLERACAALLSEQARVLDIAQECGFTNASHFSRAFSSQYGMSPTIFRQQHRAATSTST